MNQGVMRARLEHSSTAMGWRFLSTTPLSGKDNMAFDCETLSAVELGTCPPTVRFFRFKEPTVTYGRSQILDAISKQIPLGWPAVQRPTGGGVVFHTNDLCFSLCWPKYVSPLPIKVAEQYAWIHRIVLTALSPLRSLRLATCADVRTCRTPIHQQVCFADPVGYDVLSDNQKIVGGAIAHRRAGLLYQGSVQGLAPDLAETLIRKAFQNILCDA